MSDKMTREKAIEIVTEFIAMPPYYNTEKDEEACKIILSHARECPRCKKVEEVVGKLRRLWDRAGEETSFCAEYKREEIEYMLSLLTKEEPCQIK